MRTFLTVALLVLALLAIVGALVVVMYRSDDGTRPAREVWIAGRPGATAPPADPAPVVDPARVDATEPAPVVDPVPVEPPSPAPVRHRHAAPMGMATAPGTIRPEPYGEPYRSHHHPDTVRPVDAETWKAPIYSPAFAAAMGYDRPDRRVAR